MDRHLILLRHAKSSWNDPSLTDHARTLNKRGLRDAPEMGRRLAARRERPALIISSDAVRALTTATTVAKAIGINPNDIVATGELYLASPAEILQVLADKGSKHTEVMLVGHNPGMTSLANQIGDARIDNMPTCSMFCATVADEWDSLMRHPGRFNWFDYPKKEPD